MRGQAQAAVQQQRVAVDAAGDAGVLQDLLQQREEGGGVVVMSGLWMDGAEHPGRAWG
jgi:hypothetical protein